MISPPMLRRGPLFWVLVQSSEPSVGFRMSKPPTVTFFLRPLTLVLVLPLLEHDGTEPLRAELEELTPVVLNAVRLRDDVR
jgi:hypothetical protein